METYKRRPSKILLWASGVFSLLSLVPHLVMPLDTSPYYAALTVVLLAINAVSLVLAYRSTDIAVQLYWWSALAVVGGMVMVDVQSSPNRLPVILAIPPVATIAIKLLVSLRAAIVYGIGVVALLLPAGAAYNDMGRAGMLAGVLTLGLVVSWIKRDTEQKNLNAALCQFCDDLTELADEYVK